MEAWHTSQQGPSLVSWTKRQGEEGREVLSDFQDFVLVTLQIKVSPILLDIILIWTISQG